MTGLRLSLGSNGVGEDRLDGGWWPRSRDLAVEFAELVEGFPTEHGRVVRATYSRPDWDDAPRRVNVRRGYVKVGSFARDDTKLIYVTTSHRVVYCLLVVPPGFNESQGAEAMLAAATRGNRHSASELLDVVTNERPVDPAGLWAAEGS